MTRQHDEEGADPVDPVDPLDTVEAAVVGSSDDQVGDVPGFSAEEYAGRLDAVRSRLRERGEAALVVVDPANLYYLTGYNAWSFYTPQCLVLPADGLPHLFMRAMDAQGAHFTANLPRERIHGYPESLVHRPDAHPFAWIVERARQVGVLVDDSDGPVAVEMDAHFFSPRGFLALHAGLPETPLVDSRELVNWVRLVKSPAEQDLLRVAGEIASQCMRTAIEEVRPGRRQCDVVAEIQHTQVLGARSLGGDYPAIVPMLPTGVTAGTPHLTWSDLPLRSGEATTIELAGVRHRYHAPFARTVSLGTPPGQLASCASAVADGMVATLEAIKPGATGSDLHAAFNDVINPRGLTKESRIGYSIGIGYPPDWGERTVSLRAEEQTRLSPGMSFHVILGMWMDGWGYELSESVLVGADGPEVLTDAPRTLTIH